MRDNSKILMSGIRPLHRRILKKSLKRIGARANVGSNSLRSVPSLPLPVAIHQQEEQVEEHQQTNKLLAVAPPLAETTKSRGNSLRRRRKSLQHS